MDVSTRQQSWNRLFLILIFSCLTLQYGFCQLGLRSIEIGIGVNQSLKPIDSELEYFGVERQFFQPKLSLSAEVFTYEERIRFRPLISLEQLHFEQTLFIDKEDPISGPIPSSLHRNATLISAIIRTSIFRSIGKRFSGELNFDFGGIRSINGFWEYRFQTNSDLSQRVPYALRALVIGYGAAFYYSISGPCSLGLELNTMRYFNSNGRIRNLPNPMNFMLKLRRTIKEN